MMTRWTLCLVGVAMVLLAKSQTAREVDLSSKGRSILSEVVSREWAGKWKGSTLEKIRLVAQKPNLAHPTGLPPVWVAEIRGPGEMKGRLMWVNSGSGELVEFTLDSKFEIKGAVVGVPKLQQFPIKGSDGKIIASGCVPTAAACVVDFWADEKFPQWRGEDGKSPVDLTKRIRARLKMTPFPDTDGFTSGGMTLAAAYPLELAKAIQADAREKKVDVECRIARFSFALLQSEVKSGRPVLLSCTVRVPHKPHLSWGHEVVGVAWTVIDGVKMVGVVDNFFPTKNAETIRWIREDAFRSLISIRPAGD